MQRMYHSIVKDVDELRERLISVRCELDQSVVNVNLTPSTSGGVVCQPVSTLKADILNIIYDCYCQIIMSKWQYCKFDNWR